MADVATAPTITEIVGQEMEREARRLTRVCLLTVVGDASGVSGTPATNWWQSLGFSSIERVDQLEPLTASTPDEDEYHWTKWNSSFSQVFLSDGHAGSPMSATTFTAKVKVVGIG